MNISDQFFQWAARTPEAAAVVEGDEVISYRQLEIAASCAAAMALSAGCREGSVVGTCLRGPVALHLAIMLGLARIGVVQLVLNATEPPAARDAMVRQFRPGFVMADHPLDVPGVKMVRAGTGWLRAARMPRQPIAVAPGGDAPWMLVLSSGTTGRQKAALVTHRMEDARRRQQPDFVTPRAGDRYLCMLPIEVRGARSTGLRALSRGATVIAPPASIEPAACVELLARAQVRWLIATPSQLRSLLPHLPEGPPRFPDLGVRANAGATPRDLLDQLRRRLTPQIFADYGANDAGTLAIATPDELQRYPDTVGRVVPEVELQIVDDAGRSLPPGVEGEVCLRSPGMIGNYVDDQEASQKAFRNGWFFPGDIGEMNSEGFLFIRRRSDNLIDVGGRKISPREIEETMLQHPAVEEAVVFALPSKKLGAVPAVAVVLNDKAQAATVFQYGAERLADRAARYVMVVDSIPRDSMGKISQQNLIDRFLLQRSDAT